MTFRVKNLRTKTQFDLRDNQIQKNVYSNKGLDESQMPYGVHNNFKARELQFFSVEQNQNQNEQMNQQKNFLDRVLQAIQKQTNYDEISEQQILQEREHLKNLIKELNKKLNQFMFQENRSKQSTKINKKLKDKEENSNLRQRSKLKTSMAQATELKYQSILQEIHNNYKLLSIMKNQYSFLTARTKHISDPYGKLAIQSQIGELFMKIKNIKSEISVIKTKKIRNQKTFIIGNKKASVLLNQLEQQNLNLLRKIQILQIKKQQAEQGQIKIQNLSRKSDEQFSFLKQLIEEKGLKINKNSLLQIQHKKLMYQTNKRKLQLELRKNQRDQQNYKRRYYQLLESLDNLNENCQRENYALRIEWAEQRIQQLKTKMNFMKEQIRLKTSFTNNQNQNQLRKLSQNNKKSYLQNSRNIKMSKIGSSNFQSSYQQQEEENRDNDNQDEQMSMQMSNKLSSSNFLLTEIQQTKKISGQKRKQSSAISYQDQNRQKNVQQRKYFKSKDFQKQYQKYRQIIKNDNQLQSEGKKYYISKLKSAGKQKRNTKINKSLDELNSQNKKHRYSDYNQKPSFKKKYASNSVIETPENKSFINEKLDNIHKKKENKQEKFTESEKQVQPISEDQKNILQKLLQKNMKDRQDKLKQNLFRNPLQKYFTAQLQQTKSFNISQSHVPKLKTNIFSDRQKKKQTQRTQYLKKSSLMYQPQIQQQIQYQSIVPSARKEEANFSNFSTSNFKKNEKQIQQCIQQQIYEDGKVQRAK